MNIYEASIIAKKNGIKLYNADNGEWFELIGGRFKYCKSKTDAKLTERDILSNGWITENDFIVTNTFKLESAFIDLLASCGISDVSLESIYYSSLFDKFVKKCAVETEFDNISRSIKESTNA